MHRAKAWGETVPYDLAAVVHRDGLAPGGSTEVAEIDRNEGVFCRLCASGVRGQEDREQDEHLTSRPRDPEARSRAGSGSLFDHEAYEAGESLSARCMAHGKPPRQGGERVKGACLAPEGGAILVPLLKTRRMLRFFDGLRYR